MTRPHYELFEAITKGNVEKVEHMILKGLKDNDWPCGNHDLTPLQIAVTHDQVPVANILLQHGANVNFKVLEGTSLHFAASYGFEEMAKLLIQKGAQIDPKNKWGRTPLHRSVYPTNTIANLLLWNGADIDSKDNLGYTPLHFAIFHQRKGHALVLLRSGASLNIRNQEGFTPIEFALKENPISNKYDAKLCNFKVISYNEMV